MFGRNRFRLLVEFVRALCQVTRASLVFAPSPLLSPIRSERTARPGPASASRRRGRRSRRGIILLFILGLLALFSLVTVTFVVVARIHKRGASFAAQVERTGDSPEGLMTQAALQAIRGTNNPRSVLGPHSLLEDIYGSDGFRGTLSANATTVQINGANSGFIDIAISTVTPDPLDIDNLLNVVNGYYNGRILTITSGPCAGVSARIVDYRFTGTATAPALGNAGTFRVLWPKGGALFPLLNDGVAINGAPFNGTGFGFNWDHKTASFNPLAGGVALLDRGLPTAFGFSSMGTLYHALLPNAAAFTRDPALLGWDQFYANPLSLPNFVDPAGPGGADEDYDAWDFQNMLLGARQAYIPSTGFVPAVRVPLPSLHRPEIANYWFAKLRTELQNAGLTPQQAGSAVLRPDRALLAGTINQTQFNLICNFKRRFILRPLIEDHPNFTGSNPYAPQVGTDPDTTGSFDVDANLDGMLDTSFYSTLHVTGQSLWDVDNDGDGKPDSIWVDIGLPVQTTPDGRTYKPLVAILCEDMDGKLNFNSHGNLNHLVQGATLGTPTGVAAVGAAVTRGAGTSPNVVTTGAPHQAQAPLAGTATMGPTGVNLAIGGGYGPADVNLGWMFGATYFNEYRQLLTGDLGGTNVQGRYGERSITGVPASPGMTQNEDLTTASITAANRVDVLPYMAHYEFPDDFFNDAGARAWCGFATPPDLDGDGAVGVDPAGNLFYARWIATDPTTSATMTFGSGEYSTSGWRTGDKFNNPYQLNLYGEYEQRKWNGTVSMMMDAPFQPTELERILRFNDLDAQTLSSRLFGPNGASALTYNLFLNTPDAKYTVTTESWDLPTPSVTPTTDLAFWVSSGSGPSQFGVYGDVQYPSGLHLSDLIRARSRREAARTFPNMPQVVVDASYTLRDLGMDLRRGLRFDLNRPFGNGRDDNANGTVDEPEEAALGEPIWGNTFGSTINVDLANNNTSPSGTVDPPSAADGRVRQEYAKNLYVLMMLLIDDIYVDNAFSATDVASRTRLSTQVAQWAVNVVDFRDRDSIMTGFEFDVFPFTDENADGDPWDLDDNPTTDDQADTTTFPSNTNVRRGLVWGVEKPDLLITETLALHDRNSEDTNQDPSGKTTTDMMMPDTDYDQVRLPQGSLFIEIYNPTSRDEALAGELYTNPGQPTQATPGVEATLDLTRLAGGSPVWRILVTRSTDFVSRDTDRVPDRLDLTDTWVATEDIDRVVYFTATDPAAVTDTLTRPRHHMSAALARGLKPGGYAVIGPESVTDLGQTAANRQFRLQNAPTNRFALEAGAGTEQAPYTLQSDDPTSMTATIRDILAVPIDRVDGGMTNVRLSVTEPAPGTAQAYPPADAMTGLLSPVLDEPLDIPTRRTDLPTAERDILWSNTTTDFATPFRHVHLQRLANPRLQWNPPYGETGHNATLPVNPYLTIDTMPVDLTVYNSRDPGNSEAAIAIASPPVRIGGAVTGGSAINFSSRQRAGNKMPSTGGTPATPGIDIWSQATSRTGAAVHAGDAAQPAPTSAPVHTFGYLNEAYLTAGGGARLTQANNYNIDPQGVTVRYNYVGLPVGVPFASFHWPNRPFVSATELLQVPAYSSAWLLSAHWIYQAAPATPHYQGVTQLTIPGLTAASANKLWFDNTAFRHLMPWFLRTTPVADPNNAGKFLAPHIYRALDYLHVPSRFVGADEYLNPLQMQYAAASGSQALNPFYNRVASFYPPYNKVSRYREPGKININTIYDDGTTWQALTNEFPTVSANAKDFWRDYVSPSRTGYGAFGTINANSPTMIANPFRSAAGNLLVPTPQLRQRDVTINVGSPPLREGIESTLLRPLPLNPDVPLLVSTAAVNVASDPVRNSYFHYQLLQKLGNNVTTRSNVYAIWITLGYFEVTRVAPRAGDPGFCPDGWQLGRELGSDTGEINRHRAFYLIDRTRPVGFLRGEDLNVRDCFLIQRFIE